MSRRVLSTVAIIAAVLGLTSIQSTSFAIVIRHDRTQSQY